MITLCIFVCGLITVQNLEKERDGEHKGCINGDVFSNNIMLFIKQTWSSGG